MAYAYLHPADIGGRAFLAPADITQAPVITVPGVPRSVTAIAGQNSITVTFIGPLSDGGSAVTSYNVKLSTGEQVTVSSSPAIFNGLTAGVARTAQVAAINAIGAGAYSNASNQVTPTAPPAGNINDVVVPSSRTVVFPGGTRVVVF